MTNYPRNLVAWLTPESSENRKLADYFTIARQNEAARAADASACEMQAFETVV